MNGPLVLWKPYENLQYLVYESIGNKVLQQPWVRRECGSKEVGEEEFATLCGPPVI